MNVEFDSKKNKVELEILAEGQCFIPIAKKSNTEKVVWMKSDDTNEDEETGYSYLCIRLTGEHAGSDSYLSSRLLVTQMDFKLVEE